ncbi:MAG: hypothetical protein SFW67_21425 [Myxococcaceae bacterium]|nr:hypothetical protein [Myxococcaceae bacterium]
MRHALLVSVLVLAGCPEKRAVDESDPLIQKLKAEQERLAKGGAPGGPPGSAGSPNPLAELAQQVPDTPVAVSVKETPTTVGAVTVTPRRMETAQIISGNKVKLTTTDRFVRLVVAVSTTKDEALDLSKATLTHGSDVYGVARDVQRVGQGSPLGASLGAGVSQDLVLYFEVPASAVGTGLSLVLPVSGGTLTAPLQ